MLKLVSMLVMGVVGFSAQGISTSPAKERVGTSSTSVIGSAYVEAATPGVVDIGVSATPTFSRTYLKTQDTPCINNRTNEPYEALLISYGETKYVLEQAGFTPEDVNIFLALARVEGQNDLRCLGDDKAPYFNQRTGNGKHWGESIGLWQIRTIQEENGTGTCRDMSRLKDSIENQAQCAKEIRQAGLSQWSAYGTPGYRQWYGKEY